MMRTLIAFLMIVSATVTILGVDAWRDRVPSGPEAAVDRLMADFTGDDTPGVVVGVVQAGELVFQKAYGMANLTDGIRFETDTRSNIGSVTKQFTAMGILLLQAEGKLSLDDDIRKHIPELKDFGVPVTIKNLLNHTGGYREVFNLLAMTGFQGEDALHRDMMIQIVQRQPELQSKPNTEFNYNNTGYILLATTIARVSGMSFPEYMRTHVFEPLGMMDTRVTATQGEVIPHSAQGHLPLPEGGFRSTRDLGAAGGAGGIYTTAEDLAKWMMNLRDAKLGGTEAITAITTPAILENGASTSYGLGMSVGLFGGRVVYTHTGGDTAHRAFFAYFPELESGVVIMSNHAAFDLTMGFAVAQLFFGDKMAGADEVSVPFETFGPVDPSAAYPAAWMPVSRTDAPPLTAEQLEEFTGRYYCVELETPYEIRLEEGELRAYGFRAGPITLKRIEGDDFTSSAFFFANMSFKRAEDGGVSGFMASNGRTRDVWFNRHGRRTDQPE